MSTQGGTFLGVPVKGVTRGTIVVFTDDGIHEFAQRANTLHHLYKDRSAKTSESGAPVAFFPDTDAVLALVHRIRDLQEPPARKRRRDPTEADRGEIIVAVDDSDGDGESSTGSVVAKTET